MNIDRDYSHRSTEDSLIAAEICLLGIGAVMFLGLLMAWASA